MRRQLGEGRGDVLREGKIGDADGLRYGCFYVFWIGWDVEGLVWVVLGVRKRYVGPIYKKLYAYKTIVFITHFSMFGFTLNLRQQL